jgi:hypothetical protein
VSLIRDIIGFLALASCAVLGNLFSLDCRHRLEDQSRRNWIVQDSAFSFNGPFIIAVFERSGGLQLVCVLKCMWAIQRIIRNQQNLNGGLAWIVSGSKSRILTTESNYVCRGTICWPSIHIRQAVVHTMVARISIPNCTKLVGKSVVRGMVVFGTL